MVPVVTHGVSVTVMVPLSEFPVCTHSIVKAPVSPGVESLFQTPFQVPDSRERASFLAAVGVAVGVGRVFQKAGNFPWGRPDTTGHTPGERGAAGQWAGAVRR